MLPVCSTPPFEIPVHSHLMCFQSIAGTYLSIVPMSSCRGLGSVGRWTTAQGDQGKWLTRKGTREGDCRGRGYVSSA